MNKGLKESSYNVDKLSVYKYCIPRFALNKLLEDLTYSDGTESIVVNRMEITHDIKLSSFKKLSLNKIFNKKGLDRVCDDSDCGEFYYSEFTYHYEMSMSTLNLENVSHSPNQSNKEEPITKYNKYKKCKRR